MFFFLPIHLPPVLFVNIYNTPFLCQPFNSHKDIFHGSFRLIVPLFLVRGEGGHEASKNISGIIRLCYQFLCVCVYAGRRGGYLEGGGCLFIQGIISGGGVLSSPWVHIKDK